MLGKDDRYSVASDPTRMCLCINSMPDCNETEQTLAVIPGETIELEAVVVGQDSCCLG